MAAKYQGRYNEAHFAMMGIPGGKIPAQQMREAIVKTGVDMDRLDADLQTHEGEIQAQLKKHLAQAERLGLLGTPAYIVGEYRVMQTLTYDEFRRVAADARARAKKS